MSRPTRGQGLVEFAVVLPIFMFILLGIVDVGRAVWANDSLANAAREAARFAIVHGGSATTACPVGPPTIDTRVPIASPSCPYPSPSKQAIIDVATAAAIAGGDVSVDVCYGTGCTGSTDAAMATNARGRTVTVTVRGTVSMITGNLLGLGTFNLKGSSTMTISH